MPKILIVDDESSMRFLVRITLEHAGHTVVEAPDGAAALAQVDVEAPDLVVTDFMMPVMNGAELVARLRADAETARIPIIVLTATDGAERLGADAVLRKPLDPRDLVDAAATLIERRA